MKCHIVQMNIEWEDPNENLTSVMGLLRTADDDELTGSLIVLPEMFTSGFSMSVAAAAQDDRRQIEKFLSNLAERYHWTMVGGVTNRAKSGKGLNESVVFGPDGKLLARYTKMHPFTPAGEKDNYEAGSEIVLFDWNGLKVCPLICYDLRFPELFRIATRRGAEMFVVIANWPDARIAHWTALLTARAIENQAYVVGVNRVGDDPNLHYTGQSAIIDPQGKTIINAGDREVVVSASIDAESLRDYRTRFPILSDMRADLFAQ